MFCPKCGGNNPDTGKFCRACGTDLASVTSALTGQTPVAVQPLVNQKGKSINWEGAMSKFFTGFAFFVISIIMGATGMGRGWWFWLLIPAFTMLGAGIAQIMQLKRNERAQAGVVVENPANYLSSASNSALPPPQTEWVAPESRYKTGDLVPPSVTDGTTRNLEHDSEGKTMALPKK